MILAKIRKRLSRMRERKESALHYEIAFHFVMKDVKGISERDKKEILKIVNSVGYGRRSYFDDIYNRFFKGVDFSWSEYDYWFELFERNYIQPPVLFGATDFIELTIDDYLETLRIKDLQAILNNNNIPYKKNIRKSEYIKLISNLNLPEVELGYKEFMVADGESEHYHLYKLLMETINRRATGVSRYNKERLSGESVRYKILSFNNDPKYESLIASEISKRNPLFMPVVPGGCESLHLVLDFWDEEEFKKALDLYDQFPSLNILNDSKKSYALPIFRNIKKLFTVLIKPIVNLVKFLSVTTMKALMIALKVSVYVVVIYILIKLFFT